MDFGYDAQTQQLREKLLAFLDEHIYPAESVLHEQVEHRALTNPGDPWARPAVIDELKVEARKQGLWNLFLTNHPLGPGLTTLQYAPLAELTGHSPHLAPEALNCAAPDTGNMEVLAHFG